MKFEHTSVMNFENAFRGMRNPMNSWKQSDSYEQTHFRDDGLVDTIYIIGEKDMKLAKKLIKAGSDHRKFLRQILVSVDITAPLYYWKEFDAYKVGTVANSTSTMHKIQEKKFELDDFSHEHLLLRNSSGQFVINDTDVKVGGIELLNLTITVLNAYRNLFNKETDSDIKKIYWWQMIQLLPSSYNQTRTVAMSYENIRNMRHARKNHKLSEWSSDFCNWTDTLPYAKELITGE